MRQQERKYPPFGRKGPDCRADMAKNKFNHSWLHDHINDPYVKLAQKHGYRSRAAFKLKEIDEQDKLIRPGMRIVDLGAAPGSWSQYVRERLKLPGTGLAQSAAGSSASGAERASGAEGTKGSEGLTLAQTEGSASERAASGISGHIVALDLLPMEPVPDVIFIQGDFRDEEVFARLEAAMGCAPGERSIDLVLSDMAPNLSGVGLADAARMQHVIELSLDFAQRHLKPSGALLVKAFHGSGYSQIIEAFKRQFVIVAPRKPKASRDKSSETFILGRTLKRV